MLCRKVYFVYKKYVFFFFINSTLLFLAQLEAIKKRHKDELAHEAVVNRRNVESLRIKFDKELEVPYFEKILQIIEILINDGFFTYLYLISKNVF